MALVGSTGKSKKTKASPASGAKPSSSRPRASRKSVAPKGISKSTRKAANAYLIKASGTTKKEVQGVRSAMKTGRMNKRQAVRALNESGTKKRVKRALGR